MIVAITVSHMRWLIRKQLAAVNSSNVEHLRIIVYSVGFISKHLCLVKRDPLGRPAIFQPLPGAGDRNSIPISVLNCRKVAFIVDNGDQYFRRVQTCLSFLLLWVVTPFSRGGMIRRSCPRRRCARSMPPVRSPAAGIFRRGGPAHKVAQESVGVGAGFGAIGIGAGGRRHGKLMGPVVGALMQEGAGLRHQVVAALPRAGDAGVGQLLGEFCRRATEGSGVRC